MSDSSIDPQKKDGATAGNEYKCEFVTPICTYADMDTLQEIVRRIRKAGGITNKSCGMHVHVGAENHTARSLQNLVNIMACKEDLLLKALGTQQSRVERWCKKVDSEFQKTLNKSKPASIDAIKTIWYDGDTSRSASHYDDSRYRTLNLHAVWQKGTVEWRCFESTLHAGKVRTAVTIALAINAQAINQKSASSKATPLDSNPKFTMRTWLIRLGLNGSEFKNVREHLLENLEGDIAFKDNRRLTQRAAA